MKDEAQESHRGVRRPDREPQKVGFAGLPASLPAGRSLPPEPAPDAATELFMQYKQSVGFDGKAASEAAMEMFLVPAPRPAPAAPSPAKSVAPASSSAGLLTKPNTLAQRELSLAQRERTLATLSLIHI